MHWLLCSLSLKGKDRFLQSKIEFESVVKMLRVPEALLETREKFIGKQASIFATEKAAVRKLIFCINLSIPRKWLRPAEENIPTIWLENVMFPTPKGGEEPKQHWFYYFHPDESVCRSFSCSESQTAEENSFHLPTKIKLALTCITSSSHSIPKQLFNSL